MTQVSLDNNRSGYAFEPLTDSEAKAIKAKARGNKDESIMSAISAPIFVLVAAGFMILVTQLNLSTKGLLILIPTILSSYGAVTTCFVAHAVLSHKRYKELKLQAEMGTGAPGFELQELKKNNIS